VLDEAHGIKNIKSNRYKILIKLAQKADYRLMLTGTPLQNNFLELWALLNFLMPKVFGDVENFDELLKLPVEDQDENDPQIKRLKQIISPFLLRRLKSDVLASLPPKTLSTVWCNFTTPQSKIYSSIFALSKSKFASLQREKEQRDQKKLQDSQNNQNSQSSQDSLIDDQPMLKKEKSLQITTEIKEIDQNEKENILQNEPVSLHHILMQLRKGANNALLFRSIYTDEDLLKIQNAYNAIKGKEKGHEMEIEEAKENHEGKENEEKIKDDEEKIIKNEMEIENENENEDENENENENDQDEEMKDENEVEEEKQNEEEDEDENSVCHYCEEPSNSLFACGGVCKRVFHLKCIGLKRKPKIGSWLCIDCEKLGEDFKTKLSKRKKMNANQRKF